MSTYTDSTGKLCEEHFSGSKFEANQSRGFKSYDRKSRDYILYL